MANDNMYLLGLAAAVRSHVLEKRAAYGLEYLKPIGNAIKGVANAGKDMAAETNNGRALTIAANKPGLGTAWQAMKEIAGTPVRHPVGWWTGTTAAPAAVSAWADSHPTQATTAAVQSGAAPTGGSNIKDLMLPAGIAAAGLGGAYMLRDKDDE